MTDAKTEAAAVSATGVSSDSGAAAVNATGATTTSTDVEVKVGDKTVKVSADVASALQAAQKAAEDAGASVAKLTEDMAALKAAATKPTTKADGELGLDVLLFSDPDKAIQKITESILAQVDAREAKKSTQQMFWDEFYKQNADLKENDDYVRYVFQREYSQMTGKKMTVEQSIKHLGEAAKGDLLKLRGKGGSNARPVGEGNSEGTRGSTSGSDDVSEGSPTSTASILADRAAARRAAKQPGRKAK